mmetsp:Transcript_30182/g.96180  ORF Transcript_30182/g.96180 Transcript_30182/m.96180 type:complete len:226 (+) Transcript_30182:872-1549(+)
MPSRRAHRLPAPVAPLQGPIRPAASLHPASLVLQGRSPPPGRALCRAAGWWPHPSPRQPPAPPTMRLLEPCPRRWRWRSVRRRRRAPHRPSRRRPPRPRPHRSLHSPEPMQPLRSPGLQPTNNLLTPRASSGAWLAVPMPSVWSSQLPSAITQHSQRRAFDAVAESTPSHPTTLGETLATSPRLAPRRCPVLGPRDLPSAPGTPAAEQSHPANLSSLCGNPPAGC